MSAFKSPFDLAKAPVRQVVGVQNVLSPFNRTDLPLGHILGRDISALDQLDVLLKTMPDEVKALTLRLGRAKDKSKYQVLAHVWRVNAYPKNLPTNRIRFSELEEKLEYHRGASCGENGFPALLVAVPKGNTEALRDGMITPVKSSSLESARPVAVLTILPKGITVEQSDKLLDDLAKLAP